MVDVDRFGFRDLWAPYFKGHANDLSVQSHSLKADHPCFLWTGPFQERLSLEYLGSQVTVRFPFQTKPFQRCPWHRSTIIIAASHVTGCSVAQRMDRRGFVRALNQKNGRQRYLLNLNFLNLITPSRRRFCWRNSENMWFLNQKVLGHVMQAKNNQSHCSTCVGFGSMDWGYRLEVILVW